MTHTPLHTAVRAFLDSSPDGWHVHRVDLHRRGALTAVLARSKADRSEFQGASACWSSSETTVRLFAPHEDPRLFPSNRPIHGIEDLADAADLRCLAYRPLKRVVFAATLDGAPAFVKLRHAPAPDSWRAIGPDPLVWPWRVRRFVDAAGSIEAWRSAGVASLRERRASRTEYLEGLSATAGTLARLATKSAPLPLVRVATLVEDTARQIERQQLLFGDGATAADLGTVSATLRDASSGTDRDVVIHGDLHDGQVFLDDTGHARFIDPDSLATGPLEWDAANLAAHLDLAHAQSGAGEPDDAGVDYLRRCVKEALPTELGHSFSESRFQAFRSLALLRLSGVYGCRPMWRHLSGQLRRFATARSLDGIRIALVVLSLVSATLADASVMRLREGAWVEVEGEHRPGRRFKAEEVQVKNPDVGRLPEAQGRILSIDVEARRVSVVGLEVELSPDAVVTDERSVAIDLEALETGMPVEVGGLIHVRGNRWRAASIRKLVRWKSEDDAEIEGYVSSIHRSKTYIRFEVNGVPVRADEDVDFVVDDDAVHLLAAPIGVSGSDRSRSSEDWQPRGTSFIHRNLTFGARITARVLDSRELDLDETQRDDMTESNVSARVFGRWQPSPWFETYAELRGSNREALQADSGSPFDGRDRTEFRSGPTYVFYRPPSFSNVAGQVGRVDVEEDREWFYDQNLDGARLFFVNDHVRSELGVYRTSINPKDGIDDEKYVVISLESRTSDFVSPAVFYVDRRDRREPDNLRHWIGGRLPIDIGHVRIWNDGVIAQGQYRGKRLRTWAADTGLLLHWKAPFRGSVYGGYAVGSGDANRDDATDREYRDTGLADNTGVMDGLKSFSYYGELTDPELTNLRVWTAGAGMYATSWMSIDLILHGYRQMHFRDRFRSDIPLRPEGLDKNLGQEIDVFVGVRGPLPVDVELGYSRFQPGLAFASRKSADQFRVEVEWRR